MTEVATEIFNSTINEGDLYDDYIKAALNTRYEKNTIVEHVFACTWVSLAGRAITRYKKQYGQFVVTTRDRLELSIMLHDYYEKHLDEAVPEQRIELAKRVGLPGLSITD